MPRTWFLAPLVILLTCAAKDSRGDHRSKNPNVVLILADDMGLASLHSANSSSGVPTPHLDRLATQGMTLTDAHSGSAVCSPTRYGLLTGRHSWRTRMKAGIVNKWEGPLIDAARVTLADLLRDAGYSTACIGKWHLGWQWPDGEGGVTTKAEEVDYTRPIRGGPLAHGFDHYFGDDVPNWPPYVWIEDERALGIPTDVMAEDGANGVRRGPAMPDWSLEAVLPTLTQRCVDHIARRAGEERPFFLFFSMTSPHTPINPAAEFQGSTGKGRYADFLAQTDASVGRVLQALEDHGIADDTLVIFTADNGTSPKCDFEGLAASGADLRAHWRGHKGDLWEGGHRVPFLVRWPGVVDPGTASRQTVCLTDVYATVAEAIGVEVPAGAAEDSRSLLLELAGATTGPRKDLVVHHSSRGRFAVRAGRWKLLFSGGSGGWSDPNTEAKARERGLPEVQLYDMLVDPGETHNLQAEHPEVVAELTGGLRELVLRGQETGDPGASWWKQLPWSEESHRPAPTLPGGP